MSSSEDQAWCPLYKWRQTQHSITITAFIPCLQDDDVTFHIDARLNTLVLHAKRTAKLAGNHNLARSYTLSLNLAHAVDSAKSACTLRHDHVRIDLVKAHATPSRWRTLQHPSVPKNPNERPDFDHFSDSDDSDDGPAAASAPRRRAAATAATGPTALARVLRALARLVPSPPDAYELALFAAMTLHLALAPLTKVEESFNLQATHDVLFHGGRVGEYDHHAFPGVVPRTFAGAVALAAASAPLVLPLAAVGAPKPAAQFAVRLVLGASSVAGLAAVRRATSRRFGPAAGKAFVMLSVCQFHQLFYASRTLPNTFGGVLCSFAVAAWMDGRAMSAIRLLTVATAVFRAELLLLLAPMCLFCLAMRQVRFWPLVYRGAATAAAAVALTAPLDSVLWRRALWPEAEVLFANTVLNVSANYGTSPYHWYLTSALPRALLVAYPLSLTAALAEPRARPLVLLSLAFVLVYAILPHKELRFVLYVVPPLNAAAAALLARIHATLPVLSARSRTRRVAGLVGRLAVACGLAASAGAACLFAAASRLNYPGGNALIALHRAVDGAGSAVPSAAKPLHVHIGVAAAESGVSRFLERPRWRYSKQEGLRPEQLRRFSHVLVEPDEAAKLAGFVPVHTERGFVGASLRPPFLRTEPKVVVMRRAKDEAASPGVPAPASSFVNDF